MQKSKVQFKNQNFRAGFTLIEILVSVAIIGVLSSLLMVNFIAVRQRGRDSQRKSNISQIQSALEIYRADQGSYPPHFADATYRLTSTGCVSGSGGTLSVGSTVYMQKIPCPPSGASGIYNGGTASNYYYYLNGNIYTLAACLENANDSQGTTTGPTPAPTSNGTCATYYIVSNP